MLLLCGALRMSARTRYLPRASDVRKMRQVTGLVIMTVNVAVYSVPFGAV